MKHDIKFKDLTGQKYNRLTVLEYVGIDKQNCTMWKCRCDCGNVKVIKGKYLRNGNTKSCGCLNIDRIIERNKILKRTHGETKTKLFRIWTGIKTRCNNPHSINYADYGGRGIKLCDEWSNSFVEFRDWALANGYKERLVIDRIDNNGNYEPDNCRWVTAKENNRNRRSNTLITYKGETHCIADWADIIGMRYSILQRRLNNPHFTLEQAFERPVRKRRS